MLKIDVPLESAGPDEHFHALSITGSIANSYRFHDNRPASIFEKSRMSLTILNRHLPDFADDVHKFVLFTVEMRVEKKLRHPNHCVQRGA